MQWLFLLLLQQRLRAANVGSVGALFALSNFEGDGIANLEVVEYHTDQVLRVEEKILRLAFARDESESTRRERFDCSGHVCLLVVSFASIVKPDLVSSSASVVSIFLFF